MVTVRVPATTANLGPGFDCLGAALDLYARFKFEETGEGLVITGCDAQYAGADNLVYRAFLMALERFGERPRGLRLAVASEIPPARGLGSSAACIVGGIMGAASLRHLSLSPDMVFDLAADMEGHPDNAAAAVFGGLRVSMMDGRRPLSLPAPVHPDLRLLALVPDFCLKTDAARGALPEMVFRKDAVYNLSHTAFLLKALETGDVEALRAACRDRLHQQYRFPLIRGGEALAEKIEALGAPACFISGSGPSLMCLYRDPGFPDLAGEAVRTGSTRFQVLQLRFSPNGAVTERTGTR